MEVAVDEVRVLNAVVGPLPLPISEAAASKAAAGALREELRLENRVLDLRRCSAPLPPSPTHARACARACMHARTCTLRHPFLCAEGC